jgi:hypothetical protein
MNTPKAKAEAEQLHPAQGSHSTQPPSQMNLPNADLAIQVLKLHLDAFKLRYDLFVKAVGIYLAIVGAVIGYVTRKEVGVSTRCALSYLSLCVRLQRSMQARLPGDG